MIEQISFETEMMENIASKSRIKGMSVFQLRGYGRVIYVVEILEEVKNAKVSYKNVAEIKKLNKPEKTIPKHFR